MLSVRTTAFEKAATDSSSSAAVEPVSSDDLAAAQVFLFAMQSWVLVSPNVHIHICTVVQATLLCLMRLCCRLD